MKRAIIFLIGLMPLAFIQEWMKCEGASGLIRIVVAFVYLIALRMGAEYIQKS